MNYNVRINVSLLYFDPKPNKNNNNSPFLSIMVFVFKNVKDLVVTMVFCTQEQTRVPPLRNSVKIQKNSVESQKISII